MTAAAERQRQGGGHWVAAAIATVVSVAAHVALVEVLPDLPVRRVPPAATRDRRPPMELRDVRSQAPAPLDHPPRFRPEDPGVWSPSEEAMRFTDVLQPVLASAELRPRPAAVGPRAATAEPEAVRAAPSRWEPRQDVFMIEHGMYAEDIRANPRRFVDADLRAPAAPDIVVPAALDEISVIGGAGHPAPDPMTAEGVGTSFADAAALMGPVSLPDLAGPGPAGSGMLREIAELAGAGVVDSVPFEAVEDLLRLKLEVDPAPDDAGHTYFRIAIERRDAATMPVMPKDVLLIQDCSESMTQRKLNDCKDGLRAIVGSLGADDRFDIMTFRERTARCFGFLREATPQAKARAVFFIEAMEARGKTDVYASLKDLMAIPRRADRPLVALLITDGRPTTGLVDSSDIIESFTRHNLGQVSVFALGGGRQVNRFLLDLLSYRNRGDSHVVPSRQDLAAALDHLGRQLARPVMIDLRYRFSGIEDSELYPRTLTHLYLDRPLELYGHFAGDRPRTAFQIVGVSADGKKDMVFDLDWSEAEAGSAGIRKRWAYHQVYDLIGRYVETGQDEILDRALALADRFGLAVPYGRDVVFR